MPSTRRTFSFSARKGEGGNETEGAHRYIGPGGLLDDGHASGSSLFWDATHWRVCGKDWGGLMVVSVLEDDCT